MRNRAAIWILFLSLGALGGVLTMTLTHGQPSAPPNKLPPEILGGSPQPKVIPPSVLQPVSGTVKTPNPMVADPGSLRPKAPAAFDRFRNVEALPDLTRQVVHSTKLGMEWVFRYHQPHGRFLPGYFPAVNLPMESDHAIRQAITAFTLARAARYSGDDRYNARATQAALTLLIETVEGSQAGIRMPAQRSMICNRLGMAGYLVMTLNELPDPTPELIAKSEELCAFIRTRQREDGSLMVTDEADEKPTDADAVSVYPGPAIMGLMLSQRTKPAAWKTDVVRKACAYYRKTFRERPHPTMVPWMTAACTEAYALTREATFAEFAFEMNDWLCQGQYDNASDTRRALWRGGFMTFEEGKFVAKAPSIESAAYAQSLADACRLIRVMQSPDTARYDRYRTACVRGLQFLGGLQFTESNTLHFASNYRPMLIGGFHPTQEVGDLRIDQSSSGVSAMMQFLAGGIDR